MELFKPTAPPDAPIALPTSPGNGKPPAPCSNVAERILELDPNIVFTPESNRAIPLESITGLVESLREHGQLVLGIVASHPDKPGCWWLCLDGNRRLMGCRVLGIKFKAVVHHGPITPGALALTRLNIDKQHKKMSDDEVAADLYRIMDEFQCTQAEAARKSKLSAPEANKALKYEQRAVAEVKQAFANKTIVRDVARAISTVPPDKQKELLDRAIQHNMKSDAVEILAAQLRGKRPKNLKPLKASDAGAVLQFPADWGWDRLTDWLQHKLDVAKRSMKIPGLPASAFPSLLRS
jgi:ParB/RepB/Spo0J family partition protein